MLLKMGQKNAKAATQRQEQVALTSTLAISLARLLTSKYLLHLAHVLGVFFSDSLLLHACLRVGPP